MMGGEMYCDGGIVASNPAAVAVHEARTLFPDIPIELVVSVGTGAFLEQKSAPRIGWDGIIGQIVNSATDGEQIHHILEDILGESSILGPRSSVSKTRYFRFNPVIGMPDEFPIDVTDPKKLTKLRQLTKDYMNEPEQCAKLQQISDLLGGRDRWKQLVISKPGEVKR
jgi:calcium-independent phospholipase A2-gamma